MTNNNETTITLGELDKLSSEGIYPIDIRDEAAYTLGHIPGAIRMDEGSCWQKVVRCLWISLSFPIVSRAS